MQNQNRDGGAYVDSAFVSQEIFRARAVEARRLIRAVANFVNDRIVRPINIWHERQSLYEELDGLSDRILADLGISRANIRATVNQALPYRRVSGPANDRTDRPVVAPAATAPVASNDQEGTALAA